MDEGKKSMENHDYIHNKGHMSFKIKNMFDKKYNPKMKKQFKINKKIQIIISLLKLFTEPMN